MRKILVLLTGIVLVSCGGSYPNINSIKPYLKMVFVILSFSVMMLSVSCSKEDNSIKTVYGPAVTIGNGQVRAWVSEDPFGKPTAVGISLSEEALNNLPLSNQEYILTFDPGSATQFYKFISLNWSALGHIPTNVYDIPHYDVHFFTIEESERMMIGSNGANEIIVPPAAKYIPSSYDLLIGGAPMMGAHWFDLLGPEFNGSTFTKTFIWGSNNGKFIFWEPMITHDYLMTKPNSEIALRQPEAFQQDGWYPQSYTVSYSSSTKEYIIALSNLSFQKGE